MARDEIGVVLILIRPLNRRTSRENKLTKNDSIVKQIVDKVSKIRFSLSMIKYNCFLRYPRELKMAIRLVSSSIRMKLYVKELEIKNTNNKTNKNVPIIEIIRTV